MASNSGSHVIVSHWCNVLPLCIAYIFHGWEELLLHGLYFLLIFNYIWVGNCCICCSLYLFSSFLTGHRCLFDIYSFLRWFLGHSSSKMRYSNSQAWLCLTSEIVSFSLLVFISVKSVQHPRYLYFLELHWFYCIFDYYILDVKNWNLKWFMYISLKFRFKRN